MDLQTIAVDKKISKNRRSRVILSELGDISALKGDNVNGTK